LANILIPYTVEIMNGGTMISALQTFQRNIMSSISDYESIQKDDLRSRIQLLFWCCSCLRSCTISRRVAGSVPVSVVGIIHWLNHRGHTMILGWTQSVTKMSTRKYFLYYKGSRFWGLQSYPFMCQLSWNLGASATWNTQGLYRPVIGLLSLHHYCFLIPRYDSYVRLTQFVVTYGAAERRSRFGPYCSLEINLGNNINNLSACLWVNFTLLAYIFSEIVNQCFLIINRIYWLKLYCQNTKRNSRFYSGDIQACHNKTLYNIIKIVIYKGAPYPFIVSSFICFLC
jgi:hypothetical protein